MGLSTTAVIIIVFIGFFLLLLSGHYISTILFAAGALGIYLIGGWGVLRGLLTTQPYTSAASYSLTTIPLYILMAQFIMKAGIIQDLYTLVYKVSGGKKNLLGVLTIVLGGLLGAVSGSGVGTSAALGQIAHPELKKRGYSDGLAGAICAASGSLSPIIPPSVSLVLYGVIAECSISQLFEASVMPELMCIVVFSVVTMFFLNKEKNDPVTVKEMEKTALEMETKSKGQYAIVLTCGGLIILSIFGGIFSGLFTPTEAGGVGAFIGLVAALLTRSLNFKFFLTAIVDAVKTTAMTLSMIIGAAIFSKFISLSLIPRALVNLLEPMMDKPGLLMVIVLLIYFVMFMLMDGSAPLLMTVPIFLPIVQAAGFDPIWFGILVNVDCCLGAMTPPVGLNVFAVGGVTGIKPSTIFKYAMTYALVGMIIVGGLLVFVPGLATWLPNILNG